MTAPGDNGSDRQLGEIVSEVSEKATLLVREEIELAKAEVTSKAKTMARGAGVGVAAGVFLTFATVMLLHTLAWFLVELLDLEIWVGFGLTTVILILLAVIAGLLAGVGALTTIVANRIATEIWTRVFDEDPPEY